MFFFSGESLPEAKFDQFDKDLAIQIIATAKVTKSKFYFFNVSLIFLGLSIICGVISIILVAGF